MADPRDFGAPPPASFFALPPPAAAPQAHGPVPLGVSGSGSGGIAGLGGAASVPFAQLQAQNAAAAAASAPSPPAALRPPPPLGAGVGPAQGAGVDPSASIQISGNPVIDRALYQQAMKGGGGFSPAHEDKTTRSEKGTFVDDKALSNRERAEQSSAAFEARDLDIQAQQKAQEADAANQAGGFAEEMHRNLQAAHATTRQQVDDVYGAMRDHLSAATQEVDPNRFWHNAGTGKKIGLAATMLLGGAGNRGGNNAAMGLVNQAIGQDIDSQKAAIAANGAKFSQLGELHKLARERFGDETAAEHAIYDAGLERTKHHVSRIAAASGSDQIRNRADAVNTKLTEAQLGRREELGRRLYDQNYAYHAAQRGGGGGLNFGQLLQLGNLSQKTQSEQAQIAAAQAKARGGVPEPIVLGNGQVISDVHPSVRPEELTQLQKQAQANADARAALDRLESTSPFRRAPGAGLVGANRGVDFDSARYAESSAVGSGQGQASEAQLRDAREQFGGLFNQSAIAAARRDLDAKDANLARAARKR